MLEARVKEFAAAHPGEIPRPGYWKGYCLQPERIEFWLDGSDRLHDRFVYTREGGGWKQVRLYP
jgi:pyridoxamine 5'-phosphate oxidase